MTRILVAMTLLVVCGAACSEVDETSPEPDQISSVDICGEETPCSADSADEDVVSSPGDVSEKEDVFQSEDPPIPKEHCSNSYDDDGDGLMDCDDPICLGTDSCKEVLCDDGKDNDKDGLVDCVDPSCAYSEACHPENCASFYECLMVMGCQCELGEDCPEEETDEYSECQKACYMSNYCRNDCMASLSVETQEQIAALQSCLFNDCKDQNWGLCFYETCLEEFAQCYLVGEATCEEFFFDCVYECGGNPNCTSQCYQNLSANGYVDFVHWNQCRVGLCDANNDYAVDSSACVNLAGMYACLDVSGGCIPVTDGASCDLLVECVLHCESFSDAPCLASCVEGVGISFEHKEDVAALFSCVIGHCGTGGVGLVPECMSNAIAGPCSDIFSECKGEASSIESP
jgi:hypothetical protein